jgi:hypothetical protein
MAFAGFCRSVSFTENKRRDGRHWNPYTVWFCRCLAADPGKSSRAAKKPSNQIRTTLIPSKW